MLDLPKEIHSLGTFLFPQYHRLRIPMKNSSRAFYFVVTLSLLLALAGIFMRGYYSGRNGSFSKLGLGLNVVGLVLLFASVVYKKQKGNPNSPR